MWISRKRYYELLERIERLEERDKDKGMVKYAACTGFAAGTWFGGKDSFNVNEVVAKIANHLGFTAASASNCEVIAPPTSNKLRNKQEK